MRSEAGGCRGTDRGGRGCCEAGSGERLGGLKEDQGRGFSGQKEVMRPAQHGDGGAWHPGGERTHEDMEGKLARTAF